MRIILLVMSIIAAAYAVAADSHALKQRLNDAINGLNATVGIAVITGNGDTVTINNEQHYPLMSVMKLHQAIYLAHFLHHNGWNIDHCIKVEKNDLKPDTYSPLRDSIPEGTASITIGELLRYSLQLSDNNACDILFNLSGGPIATDSYIRNYGKIHDFAITATEDDMHRDTALCRANYTTPLEAAHLIDQLQDGAFADTPQLQFVRNTLAGCHTGTERIPKGIDCEAAIIMHKTGTSDCDTNGKWTAINDVAHVKMPDGRSYALAVFIKNSYESYAENERTIALISSIVFDYIVGN